MTDSIMFSQSEKADKSQNIKVTVSAVRHGKMQGVTNLSAGRLFFYIVALETICP